MEPWLELWFNMLPLLPALALIAWVFADANGSRKPRRRRRLSEAEKEARRIAAQRNAAQAQSLLEAFSLFPETALREEFCWLCLRKDADMTDADCSLALEDLAKKGHLIRSWDADMQAVCFCISHQKAAEIQAGGRVPLERHRKLVESCLLYGAYNSEENEAWRRVACAIAAYWEDEPNRILTDLHHQIALYCHEQGRLDEALTYYNAALVRKAALSEDEDLGAAGIYNNMAALHRSREAHDTALGCYERSLSILQKRLPPDDPGFLDTYVLIADTYHSLGDWDSALRFYKKAQPLLQKTQAPPARLAAAYSAMAILYAKKGEYGKAMRRLAWVLQIREAELGKTHPETAWCLYNMAEVQECLDHYDEAMELYQDAYGRLSLFPYNANGLSEQRAHYAARCLDRIAHLYREQLYYKEALDASLRALGIRESIHEKNPADIAQNYHTAAELYHTLENYDSAAAMHEQAISVWIEKYGPDAPQTALGYMDAALSYCAKEDFTQALQVYEKALAVFEAEPDCNPLLPALCSKGIANIHRSCGRLDEAQAFFERAAGVAAQWRTLHPAMPELLEEMQEDIADIKRQREAPIEKGRLLAFNKGTRPTA